MLCKILRNGKRKEDYFHGQSFYEIVLEDDELKFLVKDFNDRDWKTLDLPTYDDDDNVANNNGRIHDDEDEASEKIRR